MNATPADVERICLGLPEVELGVSWGDRPTYKVPRGPKGKGFVLYRAPHRTADGPFFTIDHFNNYNAVLVQLSRLGEISVEELREVITEAWRAVAPTKLRKEFDG